MSANTVFAARVAAGRLHRWRAAAIAGCFGNSYEGAKALTREW